MGDSIVDDALGEIKHLVGNIFGGGKSQKRAEDKLRQSREDISARQGIELPGDVMYNEYTSPLALNGYQSEFEYDPQLQGPSAFDAMMGDAGRVQNSADMSRATRGVFDIAQQGGLSAIDRARIAETRANENQWQKGQRGATMANMQARGLGGGGAELASIFDQQQAGANRNSMADIEMEGMAQQRQDAAWRDAFGMANLQSGQSFDQDAQRATANDVISQNNAKSLTDANIYGADSRRTTREHDMENQRLTNNANVDIRNHGIDTNRENAWHGVERGDVLAEQLAGNDAAVSAYYAGKGQKQDKRLDDMAGMAAKAITAGV